MPRVWDWICEFCFKTVKGPIPPDWDFAHQSAVCPECRQKVMRDGGYGAVKGGAYATGPDPREAKRGEK